MWHTEDHKAYRMAVAGDHPPDPAKELEEPTEGGLDAPMIAVWSDGTKNQLLDYSLRDHRQWQKLQAETEELPTHMVEMMGEDKITVKTRRLSSGTRGGAPHHLHSEQRGPAHAIDRRCPPDRRPLRRDHDEAGSGLHCWRDLPPRAEENEKEAVRR